MPSPDANLERLCDELSRRADELDISGQWPAKQLRLCGEAGVFRWFIPREWGGEAWNEEQVTRGYLKLASACLTTTFIITQRTGACQRIAAAGNGELRGVLLPALAEGSQFATVGISHLTTSRRHLARPCLRAEKIAGGYRLDGFSPWVTGGRFAEHVVLGATEPDGRQVLVALPMDLKGVSVGDSARLLALSASHTGQVNCEGVMVEERWLLAGPAENVLASGQGAGTGGLQTSTLAVGLARAATDFLVRESERRGDLESAAIGLRDAVDLVEADLLSAARGEPRCSTDDLRNRANSVVLRATQAALTAAKGTGFVTGHPVGRWCREALFFLVWSCPQTVQRAHMCEFAGIAD